MKTLFLAWSQAEIITLVTLEIFPLPKNMSAVRFCKSSGFSFFLCLWHILQASNIYIGWDSKGSQCSVHTLGFFRTLRTRAAPEKMLQKAKTPHSMWHKELSPVGESWYSLPMCAEGHMKIIFWILTLVHKQLMTATNCDPGTPELGQEGGKRKMLG